MLLTSLTAFLVLWNAFATPSPTLSKIDGRVVSHTDLNGDGSQELIVALPDSCDDEGRCVLTVFQVDPQGAYRTLLPPTKMWDLSAAPHAPNQGWNDLVEANRSGSAMDDITVVRWRFDGKFYRRIDSTKEALPATPSWLSATSAGPSASAGAVAPTLRCRYPRPRQAETKQGR